MSIEQEGFESAERIELQRECDNLPRKRAAAPNNFKPLTPSPRLGVLKKEIQQIKKIKSAMCVCWKGEREGVKTSTNIWSQLPSRSSEDRCARRFKRRLGLRLAGSEDVG